MHLGKSEKKKKKKVTYSKITRFWEDSEHTSRASYKAVNEKPKKKKKLRMHRHTYTHTHTHRTQMLRPKVCLLSHRHRLVFFRKAEHLRRHAVG